MKGEWQWQWQGLEFRGSKEKGIIFFHSFYIFYEKVIITFLERFINICHKALFNQILKIKFFPRHILVYLVDIGQFFY